MPEVIRFIEDADTEEEAAKYFQNRLIQLLSNGWTRGSVYEPLEWGLHCTAKNDDLYPSQVFHSIFVYTKYRSQGHYKKWVAEHPDAVMFTVSDCNIEGYFNSHGIKYVLAHPPSFPEYKLIESHYGNKTARRSGVHLMNHIDEGLWILKKIGASDLAHRAYALHPLVQDDLALAEFFASENKALVDPSVLMLAMEYRWVANSYLSFHPSRPLAEIKLSPLTEVNQMLIADKIQNRKDFEAFHLATHPNSKRLQQYFSEWLERLGVSESTYQEYSNLVRSATGQPQPSD